MAETFIQCGKFLLHPFSSFLSFFIACFHSISVPVPGSDVSGTYFPEKHAECTFKSGITMGRLLRCQGSCKDLQKSSSHVTHLSDAVLQGSNVTFLNFSGFRVGLKIPYTYPARRGINVAFSQNVFKKVQFRSWGKK